MKKSNHKRLSLWQVQWYPQLPAIEILHAATTAVIPAILHAHPSVAVFRSSTRIETVANNVVTLAQRLQLAIDHYQHLLHDSDQF